MLEKLFANTTEGCWEVQPIRTGRGGRKSSSWLSNIVCYSDKYPVGRLIAKSLETKDAEWIVAVHEQSKKECV